jgi:hypothetical protein
MSVSRDPHHDAQLLRDLAIVNARTQAELGPLPPGGMPVDPKRKPQSCRPRAPTGQDTEDEAMKLSHAAAAATLGIAGAAAACTPAASTAEVPANEPAAQRRERPQFKLNPNPRQAYEITLKIGADAPGPFKAVRAHAEYDAQSCNYVVSEEMGAIGPPEWSRTIELKQVDDVTYVGTLYLDGMLDEDYDGPDGSPPCDWQLSTAGFTLRASGAPGETRFIAVLREKDALAGRAVTTYFWKKRYPNEVGYDNFPAFGQTERAKIPSDKIDEFFTLTLSTKKKELTP